MTRDDFNAYCAAKPGTIHVVQWGNSDVWKVAGKLFALCGWHEDHEAFTFKVTPMVFEVMGDAPGHRPAPYLASRGMSWLQVHEPDKVSDADLKQHIDVSYELVKAGLTKKARRDHGLGED
ncbi:MAG: MmcQ/YjbR family DNA-binding protein [Silicimonas sp.]|nr:MmcQ/YjbR family DNA-binding protein [Silicimonas sp.]